jgi:hypothetical protein
MWAVWTLVRDLQRRGPMEAAMLPLAALDEDDAWMTEGTAPLVRTVTTLALRMLRELVVLSPAGSAGGEDEPDAEIREIVVARGIEVRSPTRLLRWHRRRAEPPSGERPPRA